MSYNYFRYESITYDSKNNAYVVYGIMVLRGTCTVLIIPELFADRAEADKFIEFCIKNQTTPLSLMYFIETVLD